MSTPEPRPEPTAAGGSADEALPNGFADDVDPAASAEPGAPGEADESAAAGNDGAGVLGQGPVDIAAPSGAPPPVDRSGAVPGPVTPPPAQSVESAGTGSSPPPGAWPGAGNAAPNSYSAPGSPGGPEVGSYPPPGSNVPLGSYPAPDTGVPLGSYPPPGSNVPLGSYPPPGSYPAAAYPPPGSYPVPGYYPDAPLAGPRPVDESQLSPPRFWYAVGVLILVATAITAIVLGGRGIARVFDIAEQSDTFLTGQTYVLEAPDIDALHAVFVETDQSGDTPLIRCDIAGPSGPVPLEAADLDVSVLELDTTSYALVGVIRPPVTGSYEIRCTRTDAGEMATLAITPDVGHAISAIVWSFGAAVLIAGFGTIAGIVVLAVTATKRSRARRRAAWGT